MALDARPGLCARDRPDRSVSGEDRPRAEGQPGCLVLPSRGVVAAAGRRSGHRGGRRAGRQPDDAPDVVGEHVQRRQRPRGERHRGPDRQRRARHRPGPGRACGAGRARLRDRQPDADGPPGFDPYRTSVPCPAPTSGGGIMDGFALAGGVRCQRGAAGGRGAGGGAAASDRAAAHLSDEPCWPPSAGS